MERKILMVAGPNGAGKTTIAGVLIKSSSVLYEFINADEIARGLAPLHPENVALAASKLMVRRMQELLKGRRSFAFETTASGSNYVKHLKFAREEGYEINLVFLWLKSPEQAVKRVAQRVRQGGHHIPQEVVMRRYYSGLRNLFACYLPLSDRALIVDNSGEQEKLIAVKNKHGINVLNENIWKQIEEASE